MLSWKNAIFVPYLLSNSKTKVDHFFKIKVLNLHSPMLHWKMQFCLISPLQVVRFEKFHDKRGSFFETNILCLHSHILSWKIQVLPHISSPSSWIWKLWRQNGVICLRQRFWVCTALCYVGKCRFCPISSLHVVGFENSEDKMGSFIWGKHFEFAQPYVILKNAVFVPYLHSK